MGGGVMRLKADSDAAGGLVNGVWGRGEGVTIKRVKMEVQNSNSGFIG